MTEVASDNVLTTSDITDHYSSRVAEPNSSTQAWDSLNESANTPEAYDRT